MALWTGSDLANGCVGSSLAPSDSHHNLPPLRQVSKLKAGASPPGGFQGSRELAARTPPLQALGPGRCGSHGEGGVEPRRAASSCLPGKHPLPATPYSSEASPWGRAEARQGLQAPGARGPLIPPPNLMQSPDASKHQMQPSNYQPVDEMEYSESPRRPLPTTTAIQLGSTSIHPKLKGSSSLLGTEILVSSPNIAESPSILP